MLPVVTAMVGCGPGLRPTRNMETENQGDVRTAAAAAAALLKYLVLSESSA